LAAITQRPMAMYHSWDSQNAWLRQIHSHNYLHVNPLTAGAAGIADGGWCWVESKWGKVRCMVRYSEAVEPNTVWTWNAIGKASGAWQLAPAANESRKGFLLNHLITEELPDGGPQASATPTRSPARPAGTTCGCASGPPNRPSPPRHCRRRATLHVVGMKTRTTRKSPMNAIQPADTPRHAQLALVIDLNVCVGCHACVTSCKQWNTSGAAGPLADLNTLRRRPHGHLLQPRADLRGRRVSR
jgi:NAD-dependent dihydropyrimidine dehydrogenase PreA subunit